MKKTNKKPKKVSANKKANTTNNVIQFPKKPQQTNFVRAEKPYSHPFSKFMKVQPPANAYMKIKEYGTRVGRIKKVA